MRRLNLIESSDCVLLYKVINVLKGEKLCHSTMDIYFEIEIYSNTKMIFVDLQPALRVKNHTFCVCANNNI